MPHGSADEQGCSASQFLVEIRQNRASSARLGWLLQLDHGLTTGFSEALVSGRQTRQERKEALPKLRSVVTVTWYLGKT